MGNRELDKAEGDQVNAERHREAPSETADQDREHHLKIGKRRHEKLFDIVHPAGNEKGAGGIAVGTFNHIHHHEAGDQENEIRKACHALKPLAERISENGDVKEA